MVYKIIILWFESETRTEPKRNCSGTTTFKILRTATGTETFSLINKAPEPDLNF